MISRDSNYSEVFEIFAQQVGADFLKQSADFVLPENLIDSAGQTELNIDNLDVVLAAGPKLYSIVGDAHPGGGTKLDLGGNDKDLGKVETIVEQHKRFEDIVNKMPKGKLASLATKLDKLAAALDEAGFVEDSDAIESAIQVLAEQVFRDTIEGAKPEEIPGRHHEMPAAQFIEMPAAKITVNPQAARIAQMNNKAIELINHHLASAGSPVSYPVGSLMAVLKDMGVSGYKNWNELFHQINEKGPDWASSTIKTETAPMNFSRQEASETDSDRGAAANLAAAERNQARI